MAGNKSLKVVTISALSTTYVRATVSATENGQQADPTSGQVSFAFTANDVVPASGDWNTGSWDTALTGEYLAQCLVGPSGTVTLAAGSYDVWVKVSRGVETIVDQVGFLLVK